MRRLVALRAADAGLSGSGTGDLVLAVNEVATNSIRHGGGRGRAARLADRRTRSSARSPTPARIADPLAGRVRPASGQSGGHGLWLCNQVCDLVQLRAFASGSVVRLHMRRGA